MIKDSDLITMNYPHKSTTPKRSEVSQRALVAKIGVEQRVLAAGHQGFGRLGLFGI